MPTDKPLSETDDDIIDLTDLVEEGSGGGDAGDDAPVDMSFEQELEDLFGDAEPTPAQSAAPADTADDAGGDDAIDLTGLEVEEAPEKPAEDEDAIDLAGLGVDEDEAPAAAEAPAPGAEEEAMADLFGDDAAKAEGDDLLAQFDAAKEPAAEAPATDEALAEGEADEALDISDMALSALESETPAGKEPGEAPQLEPSMDDLLGDLPPAPEGAPAEAGGPDLAELATIEETSAAPAAATAAAAGAIDLAALDKLIDTAKGPVPKAPEEEAADAGRLNALAERIDALETSTATLCDKVESLPTAADGDALADALSARLEDALAERLEAIMAGQPTPDHEALKTEILHAAEEHGAAARDAMLAEVRQSLTRLESLTQEQQGRFTDFAATMETRLAEITRDLPQPDEFATKDSLSASLEALGETLSRDIAGKLDERLTELRRELRETLSTELASTLDERFAEALESAKQAARQEVEALGEMLTGRIEALESERQDSEARLAAMTEDVTGQVRDALAPSLTALEAKADRADIDAALAPALEALATKLDKADLDAALERLEAKADRADIDAALAPALEALATKLDKADLDAALERLEAKPDQAGLDAAIDAAIAPALEGLAAKLDKTELDATLEPLRGRLEAALGKEELDTAIHALREEMAADIKKLVPKAAADVIREEITALAKELL
ncbi:conserved hypothetical protein [Solidesulfovibrio fructosivorans JJ]]|uniref:Uncharacterized protein n=1 Tax=Solidesulfovibrio fructosivorans JJ] TaxID=596151 RepID=E1JZ86_SOLFR|nr:hypothetical protein [Solidesulfovibrio fructosivorans]EFL50369.1 conserved hypothetical protein [Solidesulfovibrio fructosivorans JJ]]